MVFKGITGPTTLEALAVREALALAEDLNIQAIHVASDCKQIVNHIRQRVRGNYDGIVKDIIEMTSVFASCKFSFESRGTYCCVFPYLYKLSGPARNGPIKLEGVVPNP